MLENVLLILSLTGLITSSIFLLMALVAALRFKKIGAKLPQSPRRISLLSVSLLKPLHGLEPRLKENLETFFQQDYPEYEIIFGVRHADDPALSVVKVLRELYPQVAAKIVVSGPPAYPNAKVYSLENMVCAASNPILVISDSDVRVSHGYLRDIVRPLLEDEVGLVTCLYCGVTSGGLWSRLEALGMSVEMASGVLVADMLEGMKFALGPTMVLRQETLRHLGGFRTLADYCADDYVLGNLVYTSGRKVVLSQHVIEHVSMNRSLSSSLAHQLRWMRSTRFSRPLGHIGTGLTFAMPFGILGLVSGVVSGDVDWGVTLLLWAVLNRAVQSVMIGWWVVRDRQALTHCLLYPVRDLLGFILWSASFLSSRIVWRGEGYKLKAGGKMVRESGRIRTPAQAERSAVGIAPQRLL